MTADKAPAVGAVPQGDDLASAYFLRRFAGVPRGRKIELSHAEGYEITDSLGRLERALAEAQAVAKHFIEAHAALLAERDARIAELAAKWKESATFWRGQATTYGEASAITLSDCADELAAVLHKGRAA